MLNLILFGPPGAGKGTQAAKLAEKFSLIHISTGDILRAEIRLQTPLGLKVKSVMDAGHLVSDELLIEIMESVFRKHSNANGFVFDGFPRTLHQANALDEMLRRLNAPISVVIGLEVEEEELIRRLINRSKEQGRMDDNEEIVRHRLVQYHQHTKPLMDFYRQRDLFRQIYGIGTKDEIFQLLCKEIDQWR